MKKQNAVVPIDPEKLNRLMLKISELADKYGDNIDVENIEEILDIVSFSNDSLCRGTSEVGYFHLVDVFVYGGPLRSAK
jgi:hypothetical protein